MNDFNEYILKLMIDCGFEEKKILYIWLDQAKQDLSSSTEIENHRIKNVDLLDNKILFDYNNMSEEKIKQIHDFVCKSSHVDSSKQGEYRSDIAWVGYKDYYTNEPIVYWYGAEPNQIKDFMKSYIDFYNSENDSLINSNPFLKSALSQLLFIRIHPFGDGNGRVGRIMHNLSFTKKY